MDPRRAEISGVQPWVCSTQDSTPSPQHTHIHTQQVLSKHLLNGWVTEWTQGALRLHRTGQGAVSPGGRRE